MLAYLEQNPYVKPHEGKAFLTALAAHPAGDSLKSQQRWLRFKHERETSERWRQAMGPTVNIFEHQPHFANFVLELLTNSDNFTIPQKRLIVLGALCHDTGEAKFVQNGTTMGIGDIAAPDKTELLEKEEHRMGLLVLSQLAIARPLLLEYITAYRQMVIGENEKLSQFFKAAERLEYLATAIGAYANVVLEDEGSHQLTTIHDWNLIASVLIFDLTKILNVFLPQHPSEVGAYLRGRAWLIDGMFSYASTSLAVYQMANRPGVVKDKDAVDNQDRIKDLMAKLPQAQATWEAWLKHNTR